MRFARMFATEKDSLVAARKKVLALGAQTSCGLVESIAPFAA